MLFHDLDLADQLLIARRGTAYFATKLAEISDTELSAPSLLSAWTRRHLLAHVGYNAAALCRLMDWAATGVETPMYASAEQRSAEIAEGATLNAAALRHLFTHTAARLDEKWRHLPDSAWSAKVRTAQGRTVPAAETAWMRGREVWIHAVDLNDSGRFGDFPPIMLNSLLTDISAMWRRKGLGSGIVLAPDDNQPISVTTDDGDNSPRTTISGPLSAVVRWAAGRGGVGLRSGADVTPPPWL